MGRCVLIGWLLWAVPTTRAADPPVWFDSFAGEYQQRLKAARDEAEQFVRDTAEGQKESLRKQIVKLDGRISTVKNALKQSQNQKTIERAKLRLAELTAELAGLQSELKATETKLKAEIEERVKTVSIDPLTAVKILDTKSLAVGQMGKLPWIPRRTGKQTRHINAKVLQVIDDDNLLATTIDRTDFTEFRLGETVWVSGVDTSKMADDSEIELPEALAVVKTRRYESKGGARTIFVLEPVTAADLRKLVAENLSEH